ncbi:MAG: hypothetical protein ACTSR3_07975, partial [Candidatus Helarchaeota archaeon]
AVFNLMIDHQIIDLIYETENEIWIILATNVLDFRILNQIITYRKICIEQNVLTKRLRLGVVCNITDPVICQVFESKNVEIFDMSAQDIFDKNTQNININQKEEKSDSDIFEEEVCSICGGPIIKDEKGNLVCKTIRLHLL